MIFHRTNLLSKRDIFKLMYKNNCSLMKRETETKNRYVSDLLHNLSNPIRERIIIDLSTRDAATFSELLIFCDLDINFQKGLLDYHLKDLCRSGILAKSERGYKLTSLGRTVAQFLGTIRSEYDALFATSELEEGGEIVELRIEPFESKDVEEASLTRYGGIEEAKNERLWSSGNKVPLKAMGWEWGKTVSLVARSQGKVIGIIYGNTIPMHVTSKPGKSIEVVQPTADEPANRLEGEIYEVWVHPDYGGQGVEKQLIKEFMDRLKRQGATAILAERVLSENKYLLNGLKELGFQKMASYQDFKVKI